MGSTVGPRYATGTVTATNAVLSIRKVGFKPKKIRIYNLTTHVQIEWFSELAEETQTIKIAQNGDKSIVTSAGINLLDGTSTQPPGFSVGAIADVNDTTTEVLKYEAWG